MAMIDRSRGVRCSIARRSTSRISTRSRLESTLPSDSKSERLSSPFSGPMLALRESGAWAGLISIATSRSRIRSRSTGSVVALYSRWSRRSSSREISGRLPNQVLDELEANPVRAECGAEVVDEAADHLVGDPVQVLVVDDRRPLHGLPCRQLGRPRLDRLHLDLHPLVGRPEGQLQGRLVAPGLATRHDRAVTGLRHRDVQLVDVLEAEA